VDLRVTKSLHVGSLDWTLFAESKNLFNFRNVLNLFIETGDVVNAEHRDKFVKEQVAQLETEAADPDNQGGILTTDPVSGELAVDLRPAGICELWSGRNTPRSAAGGPVDCVLLQRAEARFGDGDGLFTQTEYTAAFNAWYNLANAPDRFYGAGRRLRVGAEISF
jgi:hypothetical protein